MSLISIVQAICTKVGIPNPAAVVSNNDPQVLQVFAAVNEEVEEACSRHDWSALRTTATQAVSAIANGVGFVPWPAGYARLPIDGGLYQASGRLPVSGPTSSRDWSMMTSGLAPQLGMSWRAVEGGLQIAGASAGDQIVFDYQSNMAVRSQMGELQLLFAADTDVARLPERLIRLGALWRWKQAKGFDYGEDMSTYERELERVASADTGPQMISTSDPWRTEAPLTVPTIFVAGS